MGKLEDAVLSEEAQAEKEKQCGGLSAQNSRKLAARESRWDLCHQVRNGSKDMNKFCSSI